MNWDESIVDGAETDTGMRRSNNQDHHTRVRATNPDSWKRRGHIFMVADGMGAHAVGELASKMACDNIPHTYYKLRNGDPREAILKSYQEVGAEIHRKASANRDFQGMGTTCTSLIFLPEGALIAHVGDSRAYRIRHNQIDQLSFDHSLVWEVVRANRLTHEEAQLVVPKNVITRSLGPEPKVEVDIEGPLDVHPGDVYLLCSDGLSGPVNDRELGVFSGQFHPDDACRYLLHLANLRGGHDNITVVIAHIGPWEAPKPSSDEMRLTGEARERKKFSLGMAMSGLLNKMHKPQKGPAVEEHLYRTARCPLDRHFVDEMIDQVRRSQALALEQTWPIDWPLLATYKREADEARAVGNLWTSLKNVGESIVLLGLGGRLHKKKQTSPEPVS